MINRSLTEYLNNQAPSLEICILDRRKNKYFTLGESKSNGIYDKIDVKLVEQNPYKIFVGLSFKNEDYNEDGTPNKGSSLYAAIEKEVNEFADLPRTMRQKIYISGKISGIEDEAPALFLAAETKLIVEGYIVINPMSIKHEHDMTWLSYMKKDIQALMYCDAIYMLKNWKDSKGAIIEHDLALALGIKIIYE